MPLGSAPKTTISIDFTRAQGSESSGKITFEPPRVVVGTTILSTIPVGVVIEAGLGEISLVRLPAGTYHIVEKIDNQPIPYEWDMELPEDAPANLNYEDISGSAPVPEIYTYARSVNGVLPDPITGDIEVTATAGPHTHPTTDITGFNAAVTALANTAASSAVTALVDAAPGTLDTLNELAAALGDDPNFAATIAAQIASKQPADADLTTIAALSPADGSLMARVAGAWSTQTLAQVKSGFGLATVATSGGYADLSGRPTIPTTAAEVGAIPISLVDAAGDLLVGSADNTIARLAKGADGKVLGASAGSVVWIDPPASGLASLVDPYFKDEYGMYWMTGNPLNFLASSAWNNADHGVYLVPIPAGKPLTAIRVGIRSSGTYSATGTPSQVKVYDLTGATIASSPDDPTMWLARGFNLQTLTVPLSATGSDRYVYVGISGGGFTGHSLAWPSAISGDWPEGTSLGALVGRRRAFYAGSAGGLPASFNPASYGTATSYMPVIGLVG